MSTIAAKWYIKDAEVRGLQQRAEDATREFQRRPTEQNLAQVNAAREQLKQRQESK